MNTSMSLEQLKNELTQKLSGLGSKLDQYDKMQVAINLKVALKTVERYTSGIATEVRRLELAEKIIAESEKVLAAKQEA